MDSDGPSTVELTVHAAAWRTALPDLSAIIQETVVAALTRGTPHARLHAGEVSLLLTGDGEIKELNASYRDRDSATNVLSFPNLELVDGEPSAPLPGGPLLLGDIAMSIERLQAEALEQEKPLPAHFRHLLVHGTLHLLGYDHLSDDQAFTMERLEEEILAGFGLASPYLEAGEGILDPKMPSGASR